jgi:hypothetical protein
VNLEELEKALANPDFINNIKWEAEMYFGYDYGDDAITLFGLCLIIFSYN